MSSNVGVQNPNVIDMVTHDPKSDAFVLIMIETRPWDGSEERLLQLQRKVNGYLAFALDGQLTRMYPESVGKPIRLQLDCLLPPDAATKRFIELAKEQTEQHGISFVVNVLDTSSASPERH
jgi:Family of unknown function (DUF6572)